MHDATTEHSDLRCDGKKKTLTVADLHLTFSVDDDDDDDDDDNGEYYNIGNDFLSNDYKGNNNINFNKSVKKISNNINKTE